MQPASTFTTFISNSYMHPNAKPKYIHQKTQYTVTKVECEDNDV